MAEIKLNMTQATTNMERTYYKIQASPNKILLYEKQKRCKWAKMSCFPLLLNHQLAWKNAIMLAVFFFKIKFYVYLLWVMLVSWFSLSIFILKIDCNRYYSLLIEKSKTENRINNPFPLFLSFLSLSPSVNNFLPFISDI